MRVSCEGTLCKILSSKLPYSPFSNHHLPQDCPLVAAYLQVAAGALQVHQYTLQTVLLFFELRFQPQLCLPSGFLQKPGVNADRDEGGGGG